MSCSFHYNTLGPGWKDSVWKSSFVESKRDINEVWLSLAVELQKFFKGKVALKLHVKLLWMNCTRETVGNSFRGEGSGLNLAVLSWLRGGKRQTHFGVHSWDVSYLVIFILSTPLPLPPLVLCLFSWTGKASVKVIVPRWSRTLLDLWL